MKTTNIFLSLLLLLTFGWAGAEEVTVKVAGDRSAVINVVDDKAGDPEFSGTIKGAVNLKEGKSALRADLVLKSAGELEGSEADLYGMMTGESMELVGYLDLKLPPEGDAPDVLSVNLESVTDGDESAANFNMNIQGPVKNKDDVPKGQGNATFKGDFKGVEGSGTFEFSGGPIKGEEVPLKGFELTISETGDKTTIAYTVTSPEGSQTAMQMGSMAQMKPMLEQTFTQNNIKFENIDFPEGKVENGVATHTGTMTLLNVRETIKPYLPMMAMQMQREMQLEGDVAGALANMLDARMDNFRLMLSFEPTAVKGNIDVKASQLDKFYEGYLVLLPAINEMQVQQISREAGEFGPVAAGIIRALNARNLEMLKLLTQSSISGEGEMKFTMELQGEGEKQNLVLNADGNVQTKGYSDFVKKAKEANLPVAEKAVAKIDLDLKDKTNLVGDLYVYGDGPLAMGYGAMATEIVEEMEMPADMKTALEGFEFKDGGFKMTLKGNKLNFESKMTTNDMTPIAAAVKKQLPPNLDFEFSGAALDADLKDDGSGMTDVKMYFNNFMPGKNEAQIKEALGLPGSATVAIDAPADDVKLVAVEEPELKIEGKLASVQSEGKALLDTPPSAVAAGETGGGGGSYTGLIVIGLLLLVGVGGFLAFGNKGNS